jgi:hypothetical protein
MATSPFVAARARRLALLALQIALRLVVQNCSDVALVSTSLYMHATSMLILDCNAALSPPTTSLQNIVGSTFSAHLPTISTANKNTQ